MEDARAGPPVKTGPVGSLKPTDLGGGSLLSRGYASRTFLKLEVGDVRLTARMSVFGPVIVGTLRHYDDGDLGWMYMGPHASIQAFQLEDFPGEYRRFVERPWARVDLTYALFRHSGKQLRVVLPSVTAPQTALISRVFGLPLGGSAAPVAPGGLWLSEAARWLEENPRSAARHLCDDYYPGWVESAYRAASSQSAAA